MWTDEKLAAHYAKPPVLRGRIYCSPWCGAGCTKADFDKATKDAAALAKLLGKEWKPRVWENLGWHYEAERGCAHIHGYPSTCGPVSYMLLTDTPPQVLVHGEDPLKMLEEGRQQALEIANGVHRTWKDLGGE